MAPSKPVPKHEDVVIPLEVASDTDVPRRGRKPKSFLEMTKTDGKKVAKNVAKDYRIVIPKSFLEMKKHAKKYAKKDDRKDVNKCVSNRVVKKRKVKQRKCKENAKKIAKSRGVKKQKPKQHKGNLTSPSQMKKFLDKGVQSGTLGRYKNFYYIEKQSKPARKKQHYNDDEDLEDPTDFEESFSYLDDNHEMDDGLENQDDESLSDVSVSNEAHFTGNDSQASLRSDDRNKFKKLRRSFKTIYPKAVKRHTPPVDGWWS